MKMPAASKISQMKAGFGVSCLGGGMLTTGPKPDGAWYSEDCGVGWSRLKIVRKHIMLSPKAILGLTAMVAIVSCHAQLITITGTFKKPDSTALNGRLLVQLTRSTALNSCVSPKQVTSFQPITVKIVNGVLQSLQLYATSCLNGGSAGLASTTGTSVVATTGLFPANMAGPKSTAGTCSASTGGACIPTVGWIVVGTALYQIASQQSQLAITLTSTLSTATNVNWYYGPFYLARIYDAQNNLIYQNRWQVPNSSPQDVTALGEN